MQPIVINPKTKSEQKFVSDLLDKLGIPSHVLTVEELEDFGMSALMRRVDRTKKVPKAEVMKKLRA